MRTAQAQQHSASVQAAAPGSKFPSGIDELVEAVQRQAHEERVDPSIVAAPPAAVDQFLEVLQRQAHEERVDPSLLAGPPSVGKDTIFIVEADIVSTGVGTTKAADGAGRKAPKLKGPGGR